MAIVNAYAALNLVNPQSFFGEVKTATSTSLVITDGVRTSNYGGSGFTYSDVHVLSGTLMRYTEYLNGNLAYDALGFAVSAKTADSYITAGNVAGLLPIVLSGDDTINGSVFSDKLAGYTGNDQINAGAGNDFLYGGAGTNSLDGGNGLDFAVFSATSDKYTVSTTSGNMTVANKDGSSADTLLNVERLSFSDTTLAFDQTAAQGYRLYQAAFNRTPDKAGLSFWVDSLDNGTALKSAANSFIGSQEFKQLYGATPTDQQFVDLLYQNVLHRAADQGGYDYWIGTLHNGSTRADVLVSFSESAENIANVAPAITGGIALDVNAQIWS